VGIRREISGIQKINGILVGIRREMIYDLGTKIPKI
jgi:hypothetical protein